MIWKPDHLDGEPKSDKLDLIRNNCWLDLGSELQLFSWKYITLSFLIVNFKLQICDRHFSTHLEPSCQMSTCDKGSQQATQRKPGTTKIYKVAREY